MVRLISILIGALVVLSAACGDDGDSDDGGGPTASNGSPVDGTCEANLTADPRPGNVTWEQILPEGDLPAPDGWEVRPDEGEGQFFHARDAFLSVLDGDETVGPVELIQYPFEPELDQVAGIAFDQSAGIAALNNWAKSFFGPGAPSGTYEFTGPEEHPFGDLCGIAYGFTATSGGDGEVAEETVSFVTYDRNKLYLVVAAYAADDADEGIGFRDVESLREYEPFLGQLVEELRMPIE